MDSVLIIGLHRGILREISTAPAMQHCNLVHCEGPSAFEEISEKQYSVIVLDWDLNFVTGRELVAGAKSAGIPIVVACCSLPRALQAGEPYADIYLEKPVNTQELCEVVLAMARVSQEAALPKQPIAKRSAAA